MFPSSTFLCCSSLDPCALHPWPCVWSPLVMPHTGLLREGAWWDQSAWPAHSWVTPPAAGCLSLCSARICRGELGARWAALGQSLPACWVVPPPTGRSLKGHFAPAPSTPAGTRPQCRVPLCFPRLPPSWQPLPGRCHPRWGTGIRDRHQKREEEAQRACVRETGIYILALERGGAGVLLAPPAGSPLAGLGRVLGVSGPPLWGAPGSPGQVVLPVPDRIRGAAAAALGRGTSHHLCLPWLLLGLLLLCRDRSR